MITDKEVDKLNKTIARELGELHGHPRYQWVRANQMLHLRRNGFKVVSVSASGLVAPEADYERVPAYPHLGTRWTFAVWQGYSEEEFKRQFGWQTPYRKEGFYFPLLIMREGKEPDRDITETFIDQIKFERTKTVAQVEQDWEQHDVTADRATFNRLYDMIDDATTAFGTDPGKRSGGVSFPSKESQEASVWKES